MKERKNNNKHKKKKSLLQAVLSPGLWRKITSVMLALTVFFTTHTMIFPAITVDLDTAREEPGMEVAIADDTAGQEEGELDTKIEQENTDSDITEYGLTEITEPASQEIVDVSPADSDVFEWSEDIFDTEEAPELEMPDEDEPVDEGFEAGIPAEVFDEETEEASDEFTESGMEGLPAEEQENIEDAAEYADLFDEEAEGEEEQNAEEIIEENAEENTDENTEEISEENTEEIPEETEEEFVPFQVLKADGPDYSVTLTCSEEAEIPEGTELHSEIVPEDAEMPAGTRYADAAAEQLGIEEDAAEVRLLDIYLTNGGEKILPKAPVNVKIHFDDTEAVDDTAVVHFAENGPELPEKTIEEGDVSFETDEFSVFAVVYMLHFEYMVDGETYTSASLPGGEYISLADVIRGLGIVPEEEIDTFVSKIATVTGTDESVAVVETTEDGIHVRVLKDGDAQFVITMQDGATFRIDVVAEGETTAENETATISTVGDLYLPAEAKPEAKALDDAQSESAIAAVQEAEETKDIAAEEETAYQVFDISLENVEVDQYDGFRVEVTLPENVVGRDFRLFHIHDGETTEIELNTLSIPADDTGFEVVSGFTFETKDFSEFALKYTVDFTYEGKIWSFPGQGSYLLADVLAVLGIEGNIDDATLTLIMGENHPGALYLTQSEGEYYINSDIAFAATYELRVRCGEKIYIITVTDTQTSTDLSDFLKNVVITGATQDSDGKYHVESGEEYSIILTFAEGSDYQFANTGTLTYQIPEGITVLARQEDDGNINIVYKGRTYRIGFHYVLDTDGSLSIDFDEDDPDFPRLEESTNVSFRFTYTAEFNETITRIIFNDVIVKEIIFDEPEPGQAYVEKEGNFDETTGKINYTIKVKAVGDVTDVNVKDVISGNALIFNNDVQVSGNSGNYTDNQAANGFDYTFASMSDGEEITITYSCGLNFSLDTDKDGKLSIDQTKNTVTVEPDDGDPHTSEYSREITFKSTDKANGEEAGLTGTGDKIINWTIDYNPLALASAAGDTITDSIGAGSVPYMKYYGNGITVKVLDHAGNPVGTRTISYTDLTAHSDSSWTYTIPDSDTDPYHYIISYQTIVDMAKVEEGHVNVTLNNTANGDPGTVDVAPKTMLGVNKDFTSFTTEEINWVVTLDVPASGLAQAVVTDTLPVAWFNSANHFDLYKDGSLSITGLHSDEAYDLAVNEGKVIITFYRDTAKEITGLQPHEGGRKITITLTTRVDQEWLEYSYDETTPAYFKDHQNTVAFNTVEDYATVTFAKPGLEKKGVFDENSRTIQYTILLKGVSEEPVSVQDTFDTSLLEMVTPGPWNNLKIYGGNQWDQSHGETPVSYTDTPDGVLLRANTVPKDPDNGQYYSYYKIVYYLKLKDGVDLERLAIVNGGEYDLTNTALWSGHEDSFTYKTKYNFLNKELLNEGQLGDTSRKAQYRISFNPAKATLNNGEPMVMTDVMSANLSVDYSSIRIVTDPEGQAVPYSLSGGEDDDGNSDGTTVATYTVPDSTGVVITYDAEVRGNGGQTIVNTVSVNGEDKTIKTTKSYGTATEGEGAIASFKIVKVDGYDANKKLAGVKFRIFAENPNIDFGGGVKELVLETDENGEIILDGEQYRIMFNEVYHVQEVEAPEDYGTVSFDYLVTLTNVMEQVDYNHYVYYYSDSMQIKNWPLEGLVVEKQVESPDNKDKETYYQFRVSILNDDDIVDTSYNEKNGDDQFENGVYEFELKDKEQKMFWGFRKGTKYKVEEIDSKGLAVSVTYSVFDEDGTVTKIKTDDNTDSHTGILTQENEVIIFKNTRTEQKGALKFTKCVTVNGENTNSTAADGTYTFTVTGHETPETAVATVNITVTSGVAASATVDGQAVDLVDGFVVISNLTPGVYTITETEPINGTSISKINGEETTSYSTTVTVAAGETVGPDATATFTNDLPTTGVTVNKTWLVGTTDYSGSLSEMFGDVTVELGVVKVAANATEEQIKAAEISKDVFGSDAIASISAPAWSATVGNLPLPESGYKYAVKEISVKSGDADISSYFDTTLRETTVNNAPKLTEVTVNKQWKPAIPENTTITLGLYSGKDVASAAAATTPVTTIVLDGTADSEAVNINGTDTKAGTVQEISGWTAEFKNLPGYAYDADDGVYEVKYIVRETDAPDGYTVSYGGDGDGLDYVITGGTITNTETKDFEFTKIWRDMNSQDTTWPPDNTITVTFNAYAGEKEKVFEDQTLTFSATGNLPEGWERTISEDGKKTTFKITGLDARDSDGNELTYYVVEAKVDGYNDPDYAFDNNGTATIKRDDDPTKDKAVNGEYIINTPEGGYELPQTGGIGTTLFTALGSLLTAMASAILTIRRKRKIA